MNETQKPRTLETCLREICDLRVRGRRLAKEATFWQGKYAILKLENNKLRRKFQDSRSTRLPPGWVWGRNKAVCFVTAPNGETWRADTEAAAICAAMKTLWERTSFAKYTDFLQRLLALGDAGQSDGEAADLLRDQMDPILQLLNDEEMARLDDRTSTSDDG